MKITPVAEGIELKTSNEETHIIPRSAFNNLPPNLFLATIKAGMKEFSTATQNDQTKSEIEDALRKFIVP